MSDQLAMELKGVCKRYRHFALEGVDLELEKGRVMGFIGPNGAGKSTTLRIALGLIGADAGTVQLLGHPIPAQQAAAKWKVGFASEDMRLYQHATVAWHIGFMKSIYADWDDGYAATLLKRFDLHLDQRVKGLSHGQRVKAGLLMILARRPQLLILDEPTTGLDPVARTEVLDELMDVMMDEERAVLFSSHNTHDIEQFSDQITFLDRGRIIRSEDKETFLGSWRRLRIESPDDRDLPMLPGRCAVRRDGRLTTLTTADYGPGVAARLEAGGARIHSVEPMSLEEIFVAEVMASRDEHDEEVAA